MLKLFERRGIGGEQLFLDRYRAASQEYRASAVRSARMWSLIAALQVLLFGVFLVVVVWLPRSGPAPPPTVGRRTRR